MSYSDDYETEIDLDDGNGCLTAPATFSTWLNHPDDLPTLTLESVKLGKLHLSRSQLIDWLGAAEVARIEEAATPETWDVAEQAACDRADAWRRENAA